MKVRFALGFCICFFFVLAVWLHFRADPVYFTKNCFADLKYTDASSDSSLSFTGGVVFDFYSNKTGTLTVTGRLKKDGLIHGFSRFLRFNYSKQIGNNYMISFISEKPTPHDDTPEEMARVVLKTLGLTGEHPVYIQIHSDNFITIGNSTSPFLVCVIKP